MPAGYSRRALVEKLGIKDGARIAILNAPEGYHETLGELPEGVVVLDGLEGPLDFIHIFAKGTAQLTEELSRLREKLAQNGMLWVSWPKRASKVEADLNENVVREIGLENRLVDVKVAAIDKVWSGLKFVIRVKDRNSLRAPDSA